MVEFPHKVREIIVAKEEHGELICLPGQVELLDMRESPTLENLVKSGLPYDMACALLDLAQFKNTEEKIYLIQRHTSMLFQLDTPVFPMHLQRLITMIEEFYATTVPKHLFHTLIFFKTLKDAKPDSQVVTEALEKQVFELLLEHLDKYTRVELLFALFTGEQFLFKHLPLDILDKNVYN